MRDQANKAAVGLGIHVVDVRIKRIEFPDEVLASVYKRMSSERARLANDLRSTGAEQAAKITADEPLVAAGRAAKRRETAKATVATTTVKKPAATKKVSA